MKNEWVKQCLYFVRSHAICIRWWMSRSLWSQQEVSNVRKLLAGVKASPLFRCLQSLEVALSHKALVGRSYRWLQLQLSHKVSDLKSHIIHGESSQNKDFRMLGPLRMRTNEWLSDMAIRGNRHRYTRSTAKRSAQNKSKDRGVEAIHGSCPKRPNKNCNL